MLPMDLTTPENHTWPAVAETVTFSAPTIGQQKAARGHL